MKNCENCEIEHLGEYASGRFCSKKCSKGFSTKAKRNEINEKVSNTLKKILSEDDILKIELLRKDKIRIAEIAKQLKTAKKNISKIVIKKDKLTFEERKKQISKAVVKYRQNQKIMAIEYKGGSCIKCAYNKSIRALQFHHRNPEEKEFAIGGKGETRKFETVKKELDKCDLLCTNCHIELHDTESVNLKINVKKQKNEEYINKVKELYIKYNNITKIVKELNTNVQTVKKYLGFNNVNIHKNKKQKCVEYKGGECIKCKYNKNINVLQFHHLDQTKKDLNICKSNKSFENLKEELDKCILVCGNCHAEIHDLNLK